MQTETLTYAGDKFLKKTCNLYEVFKKLDLHPVVGLVVFVKNAINGSTFNELKQLPFHGHDIKVYRMRTLDPRQWRVGYNMREKLIHTFLTLSQQDKEHIKKVNTLVRQVEQAGSVPAIQRKRILLGLYNHMTLELTGIVHQFRSVITVDGKKLLRVTLLDVSDAYTGQIYSDHNHIVVPDEVIVKQFKKMKFGCTIQFFATVHDYINKDTGKLQYGLHTIKDVRVIRDKQYK